MNEIEIKNRSWVCFFIYFLTFGIICELILYKNYENETVFLDNSNFKVLNMEIDSDGDGLTDHFEVMTGRDPLSNIVEIRVLLVVQLSGLDLLSKYNAIYHGYSPYRVFKEAIKIYLEQGIKIQFIKTIASFRHSSYANKTDRGSLLNELEQVAINQGFFDRYKADIIIGLEDNDIGKVLGVANFPHPFQKIQDDRNRIALLFKGGGNWRTFAHEIGHLFGCVDIYRNCPSNKHEKGMAYIDCEVPIRGYVPKNGKLTLGDTDYSYRDWINSENSGRFFLTKGLETNISKKRGFFIKTHNNIDDNHMYHCACQGCLMYYSSGNSLGFCKDCAMMIESNFLVRPFQIN